MWKSTYKFTNQYNSQIETIFKTSNPKFWIVHLNLPFASLSWHFNEQTLTVWIPYLEIKWYYIPVVAIFYPYCPVWSHSVKVGLPECRPSMLKITFPFHYLSAATKTPRAWRQTRVYDIAISFSRNVLDFLLLGICRDHINILQWKPLYFSEYFTMIEILRACQCMYFSKHS